MNPGFFRRITSASAKIQQKKLRSNSPKEKKKNKSVYWETYFDLSEHIKYEKWYHGCRHFHCYCHGLQASPKTGFSCILSIVDSTTSTCRCNPHTCFNSFSRYFSEVMKSSRCRGQEVASMLKIRTWSCPCCLRRGGSFWINLISSSLWKSTSHLTEHCAGFDEPICSCVSQVAFFSTSTNSWSPWSQLFGVGITLICISSSPAIIQDQGAPSVGIVLSLLVVSGRCRGIWAVATGTARQRINHSGRPFKEGVKQVVSIQDRDTCRLYRAISFAKLDNRCRPSTLPVLIQPSKPEIAFPLQVL